jgi:tyrosinase
MTNQTKTTRREFLYTASLTVGGALAGVGLTSPIALAQPPVKVRPDVSKLDPNDPELRALRAGVGALKQLPESNPKSWQALASIHGRFCPHSNWFFLPWHRAYLFHFEQVCREASGDPNFVLPYWDWTTSPHSVPRPFWGANNPLMNTRQIGPNHSADPSQVGPHVLYGRNNFGGILRITDFITFAGLPVTTQKTKRTAGALEREPHNYIHNFIGGDMPKAERAPLDPIFWLHHANVDRLWTEWERLNPGRTINDPFWLNFTLEGFDSLRPQNQPALKISDTLSTYRLGYRYPSQPATPPSPQPLAAAPGAVRPELRAERTVDARATSREPLSFAITAPSALQNRVRQAATTPTTALGDTRTRLRLVLKVKLIGDTPPGVRVFLNSKIPGSKPLLSNTSYIGYFTFFGQEHEGHGPEGEVSGFAFDVTRAVRKLARAGLYRAKSDLQVSLVPFPLSRSRTEVATVKLVSFELEAIG